MGSIASRQIKAVSLIIIMLISTTLLYEPPKQFEQEDYFESSSKSANLLIEIIFRIFSTYFVPYCE